MILGQGLRLVIQALYFVEIARSLGVRNYGAFIGVAILSLWWALTAKPSAARANLMADVPAPDAPESALVGIIRSLGKGVSKAVKNVTTNERYFIAGPGGVPTMPASILTEAMAQAGAVLILSKPENRSRLVYFMGIDRVRYRRPVVAGDQVLLEAEVLRLRAKMGSLRGRALVDGKIACEGEMTFALGAPPSRA